MPRKIPGLRSHGSGWQTYCQVNGTFRSASWPKDTPVATMTAWLREQRAGKTPTRAGRDSFDHDARVYLQHVQALPTYAQRVTHIALWQAVFRGWRRRSITSADIRGQRDRWLKAGLAPHTVNLRLRALSNLWTVLDGRRAPNPVREVPEAPEPDPEPRALPYWLAERIVQSFPATAPLEIAQAQLMITIGLAPVELSRLLPRHWQGTTLFVQGRRKGQGGASRTIPLSEAAQAALRAFSEARGWGQRPGKPFYRIFRTACQRVARDPLVIDPARRRQLAQVAAYDLRHTYATQLYLESGDAHAAAFLLGHRSSTTTARYITAALLARAEKAVRAVDAIMPADHASGEKRRTAT